MERRSPKTTTKYVSLPLNSIAGSHVGTVYEPNPLGDIGHEHVATKDRIIWHLGSIRIADG
jgi:hypothetical protein